MDFGPKSSSAPHGYLVDYGRAWSASRGYGWTKAGTSKALSLAANTVKRSSPLSPDRRYDSLIQMQAAAGHGTTTAGQWQATLANGVYNVTVAVGDAGRDRLGRPGHRPARHQDPGGARRRLPAEQGPPLLHRHQEGTGQQRPAGAEPVGRPQHQARLRRRTPVTTTKPIITPPAVDVTAPQATVVLTGSKVSGSLYTGTVIATVNAADEVGGSGLKAVTYSLDGAPAQPYTAPVAVAAAGSHLLSATATDVAGNVNTVTSSWTQQPVVVAPTDTTSPTVAIGLGGTLTPSESYVGAVTATITAADEIGGSGINTVTYSLDGEPAVPYTTPLVVPGIGSHSLTVTATDRSGNAGTATSDLDLRGCRLDASHGVCRLVRQRF